MAALEGQCTPVRTVGNYVALSSIAWIQTTVVAICCNWIWVFFLCFTWIGQLGPVKAAPSDRYTLGAVNVRLGQPPGERIQ